MPYMSFSLSNSSTKIYLRQSNHFLHKYFRAIKCTLENLDKSEMAVERVFSTSLQLSDNFPDVCSPIFAFHKKINGHKFEISNDNILKPIREYFNFL